MLAVAQKVHPIAHPTWLDTHKVTRPPVLTDRGMCTASIKSARVLSSSFVAPSSERCV